MSDFLVYIVIFRRRMRIIIDAIRLNVGLELR